MLSLARRTFSIAGSLAVASVFVGAAAATADPPDRVARLSFLSGPVALRPATVDRWTVATRNYPMTTGDTVWTGASGRLEMQLGSSVDRLAANTWLGLLNLDNRIAQLRLAQGTLSISVRDIDTPQNEIIEIDTPNGAVSLPEVGFYRIDVSPAGDRTTVTVRDGKASVLTGTATFDVASGQSAVVTSAAAPSQDLQPAVRTDDWEDWCQRREHHVDAVQAQMYVSLDVIGYEDLDDFGVWSDVATYGSIWTPRVSDDWAPYRSGHWMWIEPWGWTWIDDTSWGFAPFHYGRWVTQNGRWAWVPGDPLARPVYAPALVAFADGGTGWSASLGLAEPVAWFPLGPREPFVPAYRASDGYLEAINAATGPVTDVTVARGSYMNQMIPGAITAMSRDAFMRGRFVAPGGVRVPANVSRTASILGTAAGVAPRLSSVLGQPAGGIVPPESASSRPIVTRASPPRPPVPFALRQPALSAHPGRPVDDETLRSLQTASPSRVAPGQPGPLKVGTGTDRAGSSPDAPESVAQVVAAAVAGANLSGAARGSAVADLTTRQAAARADLEAKQATEQAQLQSRQHDELRRTQGERALEHLLDRHERETRDLSWRQMRQQAQMERQQDKERRRAAAHKSS